jgi:surface protein
MHKVLLSKKILVLFAFFIILNLSAKSQAFITTWITTDNNITIPTTGTGYNYDITWTNLTNPGVGNSSITARTGNHTITGLTNGDTYQVAITGAFPRIFLNYGPERLKIRSIAQWGNIAWASMAYAFYGCGNLGYTALDAPDLTGVTDLNSMFSFCTIFNGNISNWNIATITKMSYLFYDAVTFNQPIGNWNTSAVIDMKFMFYGTTAFNQPIGNWNTSAVTDMGYMFSQAITFNQPIGNWNISAVVSMGSMFGGATAFNQPISNWNTSSVTIMSGMFARAINFNQPIGNWNTNSVFIMSYMFYGATNFNQPINNWNTGAVTEMSYMFNGATAFDQPLNNWNTAIVSNMGYMFYGATNFNQPINNWNTSTVTDMMYMFYGATAFNQPLNNWNITNVTRMTFMLNNSKLSVANYDNALIAWAAQTVKPNVQLGALGLKYCNGASARTTLTSAPKNWTITGDVLTTCIVVPVSLLNFDSKRQNENTVLLQWQTANEINNNRFEIEISDDGIHFKKIGTVAATGNSNSTRNYSFSANNITANYYRLKQIDNSGIFEYSKIVFVNESSKKTIRIFANPSNGSFEININTTAKQSPAHIYNTQGMQVWSGVITNANNKIKTNLGKGLYFLHVVVGGENKIERLIID